MKRIAPICSQPNITQNQIETRLNVSDLSEEEKDKKAGKKRESERRRLTLA